MLKPKYTTLAGWGNYPQQKCAVFRPEKNRDVVDLYHQHPSSLIVRGAGKAYGDAAMNWEGVISTERLNHFLHFDEVRGTISAQGGVPLKEIMDIVVPKGWILPVLPGTMHASIGGCVAANVHGKNQFRDGEIASHIEQLTLRLPSGAVTECSPHRDAHIFWATLGGMGMTGFIEEVTLKLRPIRTVSLIAESFRIDNLREMVDTFKGHSKTAEYMVGWIDHFGTGDELGRGYFEKARHAGEDEGKPLSTYKPSKPGKAVPEVPGIFLNRFTMALYNKKRFGKYTREPKQEQKNFQTFFHPLDGLVDWNNLYGKKGFLQYQFLVLENGQEVENLTKILKKIQDAGAFSYLAVIKYHRAHEGMLSFSDRGFSVALDFPNTPKILALLDELDMMLLDMGGRVYLAKDARMRHEVFEQMYKHHLPEWREVLKQVDPGRKINSAMARRLEFKPPIAIRNNN